MVTRSVNDAIKRIANTSISGSVGDNAVESLEAEKTAGFGETFLRLQIAKSKKLSKSTIILRRDSILAY